MAVGYSRCALQAKIENPNFEHILAVLEDLQGIAESISHYPRADDFVHVLAPFVTIERRYDVLNEPSFLRFARQEFLIVVSRYFQHKLSFKHKPEADTCAFFKQLSDAFDLTVFTLNYDQLIDAAFDDWMDGFLPVDSKVYKAFDRQHFVDKSDVASRVLCHLHGSLNFGHTMDGPFELVKFATSEEARHSLENISVSERLVKGNTVPAGAIVSGFNKAAKLVYSAVPYAYYLQCFANTLLRNPRLLIVGYGGYDDHVNTWLEEYIKIQGNNRKVAFVTKRSGVDVGRRSAVSELLDGFSGTSIIHSHNAYYDPVAIPNEYSNHGRMALCAAGFPFKTPGATIASLLNFLQ